jgi:CBS domain-containing protein
MKCRDIMRRPVQTLGRDATVAAAAVKMRDANVGLIPICDLRGGVLGVITDRDIAILVIAVGLPTSTACETVMTRDVVFCEPEDEIRTIANAMAARRKSRILVVEDDRLVGIVSLSDLAATDISLAAMALHDVASREILDVSGSPAQSQ